jgi:hypothetical protein
VGGKEVSRRFGAFVALVIAVTALAGCAPTVVDSTTAVAADDSVYYVLGIEPDNMGVRVGHGDVDRGSFESGWRFGAPVYYMPKDGPFAVIKGRPGETLGITMAEFFSIKGFQVGEQFSPCNRTLTFSAPGGKVVYVGSIAYTVIQPSGWVARPWVESKFSNDFPRAQAYIKANYPALADKLEPGLGHMLPFWSEDCVRAP